MTPFWSKSGQKWVQTDKQTSKQANRQTDIEHGFFEASTQKAPSGQLLFELKIIIIILDKPCAAGARSDVFSLDRSD